jgi:hypothetical protein
VDSILKRVAGFLRWLLASEQLPEAAPPNERGRSVTAWLLASDAIDATPTDGSRRRRPLAILSSVLAPETLPQQDAPARDEASRTGFLRRLLASETLPERAAPAGHAAPRTGFLKGLLSPQELPRVETAPRPRGRGFMRWVLSRDEL